MMLDERSRMILRDHLAGIIVENQPKPIPINVGEAQYIADAIVRHMETTFQRVYPDIEVAPENKRSYYMWGDDPAVDDRNDEQSTITNFLEAL